jgi:two-component system copper resistance phosphate regulon response regulator CusR
MRILIIEDENKTASYLSKGLKEHGFMPLVAATADDGLHFATAYSCGLIILDMKRTGRNGCPVLAELRQAGSDAPVVCLSDRDSAEERVKALEQGADDFLVKPFAFSELLARIKAILRRGVTIRNEPLRIADLEVDVLRHRARRSGKCIDLTFKEFLLLALLLRHPGEVLSRTFIAEQVWDMNFECESNVIDAVIRRVRKKIDGPFRKALIHTVRGRGYVLEDRNPLPA